MSSESTPSRPTATSSAFPHPKIRMMQRAAVTACLALGNAYRRAFHPPPPEDLYARSYEEEYFAHEVTKSTNILSRVPPLDGQRVLDLGCAYGGLLVALREAGAKAAGVDVDERRVQFARAQGLDAHVGKAEELPFPDASLRCNRF